MRRAQRLASKEVTTMRQKLELDAKTFAIDVFSQALLDVDARREKHTDPAKQGIEMASETLLQARPEPDRLLNGEKIMHHRMHLGALLQCAVDGWPRLEVPRGVEHEQMIAFSWQELDALLLPCGHGTFERMGGQTGQEVPAFALETNRGNADVHRA